VADYYLGSWLHWSDDPRAAWRAAFGEREGIARTGLLTGEASAQALADALQERGKTNWYVYRLWRLGQPVGPDGQS
jgi:hypothetical protein